MDALWHYLKQYAAETPDVGLEAVVPLLQQNFRCEEAWTAAEVAQQVIVRRSGLGAQPKVDELDQLEAVSAFLGTVQHVLSTSTAAAAVRVSWAMALTTRGQI